MINHSERHIPVLLNEVITSLKIQPNGIYLDGTFGAGGYTRAMLKAGANVIALDRDPDAIAGGYGLVAGSNGKLTLVEAEFDKLDVEAESLGFTQLDGVVLDIGVSSMQIDEGARGFSFRFDGPLDMRMAQSGTSAADIINEADEEHLANIFYYYGEERLSRRVAKAIVTARAAAKITTTKQLCDLVAKVIYAKPNQIHPATRVFQALRIAVNDELGQLLRALQAAERVLKPGGILSVVTFHSLEDRIVKQFFKNASGKVEGSRFAPTQTADAAIFDVKGKWPVSADSVELAANPRARSAKLRAGLRTDAPARDANNDLLELVSLPDTGQKPQKGKR
jgi:16S rRNA (cytosine1402-N4)-methyltransferase